MQPTVMQTGAEKIVPTAVHVAFIQRIAHGVALLRAGPAEGIVASTGIGHDGQQRISEVGVQHAAGRQVGNALAAQRTLRIVTFARVVSTIKQGVDSLIAFKIEQAQGLPRFDFEQPGSPAGITWR